MHGARARLGAFLAAAFLSAPAWAWASAPPPEHVVLVVEENHAFGQIIGSAACPYLNSLASRGLLLTRSHAVAHPSEPNYLALFSGSTQGGPPDTCPPPGSPFPGPDLGSLLRHAGLSFVGYSEGLPRTGDGTCQDGDPNGYRRKHNPWVDFSDLPAEVNRPFSDFPRDFTKLPTVAWVIPDLEHDMHNGTPAQADRWLKRDLGAYARWCGRHHGVLIVTWDEDNGTEGNRIATILVGAGVRRARLGQWTNHYGLLRTLCAWYGLAPPGMAAQARPLKGVFR